MVGLIKYFLDVQMISSWYFSKKINVKLLTKIIPICNAMKSLSVRQDWHDLYINYDFQWKLK